MNPINTQSQDSANISTPVVITRIKQEEHGPIQRKLSPDRAQYFQLLWVRSGKGTVAIDLNRHEIAPDFVYCTSPGQIQQFINTSNLLIDCISFTTEFLGRHDDLGIVSNNGLFGTYGQARLVQIRNDVKDVLAETLNQLQAEYNQYNLLRNEIMRSLLRTFLLYLTRQTEKATLQVSQSRSMELVKKFMLLLEKNFASRKMVIDYADELAVTPNYLNEVVKRVSGHPASYHIQQRIALEAKRQAGFEALSMKEVAFSLGFQDMAHFSKYFKRVVGINFTDYKKNYTSQLHR